MNAMVIAANNKEDTGWTKDVPDDWTIFIYDDYHPPGREAACYLQFCINSDCDEVVFCQGNPFGHDPEFIEHLTNPEVRCYGVIHACDANGAPHYEADLNAWCTVLGLPLQKTLRFSGGAQYRITRTQLTSRSKDFYLALGHLSFIEPKFPWIIERLWPLIWNINL